MHIRIYWSPICDIYMSSKQKKPPWRNGDSDHLVSRGWWFDPRHWQSEKLLSGWKFMASPTSSPSARSLCYKVRNSPFNTWVSATILMAYSAHCETVKIFYHFPMKVWKYLAYTKGFLNNIKRNIKFNIGHSIKSTATWGRQILV